MLGAIDPNGCLPLPMVSLGRLIIYSKKTEDMVTFYCRHFDYERVQHEGDRIVELRAPQGGTSLLLHPASLRQKDGQVMVKLVFDVPDVFAFCQKAKANGLIFGKIHRADGYQFANAKDPSQNTIQVSSRAFAAPRDQDPR